MANEQQPAAQTNRQLMLQKIYVKDLSFESPKAPGVFSTAPQPRTELSLKSGSKDIAPDTLEVTLTLTLQARDGDTTLFLVEVQQAGIFLMQGYSPEERAMLVGSFCPGTLYPFAREAVADLVARGGFPQLLLQPINFDALYAQARQERAAAEAARPAAGSDAGGGPH
jgi:preprotein translocase subunit SecB